MSDNRATASLHVDHPQTTAESPLLAQTTPLYMQLQID